MTRPIQLHIEEIVLHGFPNIDHNRVRESLQQQLTTLLARGGLPLSFNRDGSVNRLDGGQFISPVNAGVGDIGSRIAGNVYGTLAQNHNNKGGKPQ
jgi:hypothetical protein